MYVPTTEPGDQDIFSSSTISFDVFYTEQQTNSNGNTTHLHQHREEINNLKTSTPLALLQNKFSTFAARHNPVLDNLLEILYDRTRKIDHGRRGQ